MNTRGRLRPGQEGGQGSEDVTATRDKLAARLTRLDAAAPEALDLLAGALDAANAELRGVAGMVSGPRGADHFRRVFRGEEAGVDAEIARLALDNRREPRAAVRAFLQVIAHAAGYNIEPLLRDDVVDIHEAMAGRRVADATLDAELLRDMQDGALTATEAVNLEPELAEAEARLLKLRAAIAQAKAAALRRPVSTEAPK